MWCWRRPLRRCPNAASELLHPCSCSPCPPAARRPSQPKWSSCTTTCRRSPGWGCRMCAPPPTSCAASWGVGWCVWQPAARSCWPSWVVPPPGCCGGRPPRTQARCASCSAAREASWLAWPKRCTPSIRCFARPSSAAPPCWMPYCPAPWKRCFFRRRGRKRQPKRCWIKPASASRPCSRWNTPWPSCG